MVVSQGQGQGEGEFRDSEILDLSGQCFAGTVARRLSDRDVLVLGGTSDSCAEPEGGTLEVLSLFWGGDVILFLLEDYFYRISL